MQSNFIFSIHFTCNIGIGDCEINYKVAVDRYNDMKRSDRNWKKAQHELINEVFKAGELLNKIDERIKKTRDRLQMTFTRRTASTIKELIK